MVGMQERTGIDAQNFDWLADRREGLIGRKVFDP
jgi:hypothetical protein